MSNLDSLVYGSHQYKQQLQKICEPFHRLFGSNHVGFVQINNDHSLLNLHTNTAWLDRCAEEKYYLQDPCMVHPENISSGQGFYFTYEEDEFTNGILKDSIDNFNMAHELVFVNKNQNGYDVIAVTAPINNTIIYNQLLKYPQHLNKFLRYFRESIEPILQKIEGHKINLAELKGDLYHSQTAFITHSEKEQEHAKLLHTHCDKQIFLHS